MITEFTGPSKAASGGLELRYQCPFCVEKGLGQDTGYRLYLHDCAGDCHKCESVGRDLRGTYYCHRCETRGKLAGQDFSPTMVNYTKKLKKFFGEKKEIEKLEEPPWGKLQPGMAAYDYLLSRNLSPTDIDYYGVVLGIREFRGKVIIPDLDYDRSWVYWTARDYTGKVTHGGRYEEPKHSEIRKSLQVFNLLRVQDDRVFLTEGVFDAMVVGPDAIATYGKKVSYGQIRRIIRSGISRVYCALDADADLTNWKLGKSFEEQGVQAFMLELPKGSDPAILGRKRMLELARTAVRWSEFGHVRYRLRKL